MSENSRIKIALTGGPSGGKTTLLDALKKELGRDVAIVPEAASILYRGGFPRGKTETALVHTQKAIYYTQKELEELVQSQSSTPLVICDRGSLDSIAYWPFEEEHFYRALQTSREKELQRYDWVIHLDTASVNFYDGANPIRTESYEEAWALNQKIKQAWKGHRRRIVISQNDDFLGKMAKSVALIAAILRGQEYDKIIHEFGLQVL